MHTRLALVANHGRATNIARRRMRQEIMASRTKRTLFVSSHNNQGFYVPVVGMPRSHRHHTIQRAYFHTTPPRFLSLPESATALHHQYDDDDDDEQDLDELEQDIERFAASCLSQILPEDIFYKQDEEEVTLTSSALDQELGIDSMWGNEEHEEDDDDDDEFLVEEEHYLNPQQGLHQPATTTNKEANKDKKRLKQQSALEMLRNFDPQDPPASDNLEDLQLWLECAAQREAVLKYQKLVDSARDRKGFDSMSYMQRYIVRWYQSLRDAIDTRQKEYLSNNDHRRAKKRYGPLLCSLPPDKLAVVTSHEAITEALMGALRNGREGVPLVKMAHVIGSAVEVEVISQRRMRDLYRNDDSLKYDEGEDDGESESNSNESSSSREETETLDKRPTAMDKWTFSATHLKRFMEDLKRIDPKLDTSKRAVNYAVRRAKQAMNSEDQWTSEDIIHVGACLLSILLETAKIDDNGTEEPAFTLEKSWSHAEKKSTSFILLNDKLYKLFVEDDYQSLAAVTTRHTPMIIPPRDWVGPKDGGYRWLNVDFMRTHGSNLQKEALQHADLSNVFDGLNVLGRTAWKINKEILDIGQHCWANNVAIGDIPSRADVPVPLEPPRPDRIDPEFFADKESPELQAFLKENREYREALFKSRRMHQKNMDLRSLRGSAILKLDQAEKFKDFERIYFPYNLDFRGRAYPIPPHLSNVGSDLCRGMLTFADPKPLGKRGLYWLKVHLANFAGKDKMSFDARAKYVDDNFENVRASVNDPFAEGAWWMTLDDPFQGLATCYEVIRAVDSGNPESYLCPLPVHMDGSCNGLQHYAALGLDTVGGKAVNLLEGDGPQDVYIGVMHEVIRRVAEEAAHELDFDTSNSDALSRKQKKNQKNNQAAKLVNGLIDRGVVKRTVMTSVYGVTYVGARQQIQEKIEEKLVEQGYDIDEIDREVFAAAGYLATMTIEVMGDLFQGARKSKSWLADCARLISQHGHPVAWISPIGVPAIQPYRQKRARTVLTVMQSVTIADVSDDLPVHKSRQCTAFPPNYVHSLDSSHMLLTALEMDRRGLAFSAVHDSFWTHACDIDEMNEALRDCFVDLYSQPLLKDLKESWEMRYPEIDFPELPESGDLDLNAVKSATYFFQ